MDRTEREKLIEQAKCRMNCLNSENRRKTTQREERTACNSECSFREESEKTKKNIYKDGASDRFNFLPSRFGGFDGTGN
jgi:hypothetical protein